MPYVVTKITNVYRILHTSKRRGFLTGKIHIQLLSKFHFVALVELKPSCFFFVFFLSCSYYRFCFINPR